MIQMLFTAIRKIAIWQSFSSYIAHNKFIVLLKQGQPVQVWTGSTNITDGGIFGQSNLGHIIRDASVAAQYLAYWETLSKDPDARSLKSWTEVHTPILSDQTDPPAIQPIFSPRRSLEALNCYAQLMDQAQQSVFLTAAFGVSEALRTIFEEDKPYLRYLLLDKKDNKIETINRDPDNRVAAGAAIGKDGWGQWAREKLTGMNRHVQYIHTKYMLIDPLGDHPIVITGSANFSQASTNRNDENMIIIRGDQRVADIYLGEFMRLFTHFRFRGKTQSVTHEQQTAKLSKPKKLYLKDTDEWARRFYVKGSSHEKERLFFS